jgi:hypothetical protein
LDAARNRQPRKPLQNLVPMDMREFTIRQPGGGAVADAAIALGGAT